MEPGRGRRARASSGKGRGGGHTGSFYVGDLRVNATVRAGSACRSLAIELREGERRYLFTLPGPASPDDARPRIEASSAVGAEQGTTAVVEAAPRRLARDQPVRVVVQNLDDVLTLELDGEPACQLHIDPAADQQSAIALFVAGGEAAFGDLAVSRDTFFVGDGPGPWEWTVPEGAYFVLGDNLQGSEDSRSWAVERYRVARGQGRSEVIEGHHRRNPARPMGASGARFIELRDRDGTLHSFTEAEAERLEPVRAPFVPRSHIWGRAFAAVRAGRIEQL